jgi:hypothetical protein
LLRRQRAWHRRRLVLRSPSPHRLPAPRKADHTPPAKIPVLGAPDKSTWTLIGMANKKTFRACAKGERSTKEARCIGWPQLRGAELPRRKGSMDHPANIKRGKFENFCCCSCMPSSSWRAE